LSPVVAAQLGQPAINLLRVRREGGQWLSGDKTPLLRADATGPAERILGIRPEHIALDGDPGASEGVVRIVEYIGPSTTLLLDWAGERVHVVVPRQTTLRPGDRARPRIDAEHALLFDPEARAGVPELVPRMSAGGEPLRRPDLSHANQPMTKEMP
jgi:ABC-type sugar transport system ATPase subunit